MRYKAILFDLDGTLTESGIGITRSVAFALEKLGYPVPEQHILDRFVGPPLFRGFCEIAGTTEEEANLGIDHYHERYDTIGWKENRVYDGIEDLLKRLRDAGCYLAIASSKPEILVVRIVEYFGIAKLFDKIVGTTPDNRNAAKDQLILSALPEGFDPETSAMVGDRKFDMSAASRVGVTAIGALYGYGSREELEEAGADYIAADAKELADILFE